MKMIWIATVGTRPREVFEKSAAIYLQRLKGYVTGSRSGVETLLFRSSEALWEAVEQERKRTTSLLILLDGQGRQFTSEQFAEWFSRQRDQGRQTIIFAIGPADGWSEDERKRADLLLSLSPMTLPYELARVVLCEQIYRAFTILSGHPYHTGH